MVLNGAEGLCEDDKALLKRLKETGKLLIVVNKFDLPLHTSREDLIGEIKSTLCEVRSNPISLFRKRSSSRHSSAAVLTTYAELLSKPRFRLCLTIASRYF